jgi:glycosyltransferase 2 family protein
MYLSLRGANLREVLGLVAKVDVAYLPPAILLLLGAFVIRAVRWRRVLSPVKVIRVSSLFASTMIGFMANNLLPFRAGEIVRAYSISKNERISLSSAVASLVIERLLDGIVISGFLLLLLVFVSLPPWLVSFNYLLLSVYVISACTAFILVWAIGRNHRWLTKQRWEKLIRHFSAGLEVCTDAKQILMSIMLSLAHWFIITGYYYCLFLACGLSLPFLAAVSLVVIVGIGIMLPAAPGYVGNFQYFTVVALSLFAIPREDALAYSLIAHAGQFIPVTVVGLLYFVRQSIGLAELRGAEETVA